MFVTKFKNLDVIAKGENWFNDAEFSRRCVWE